ncbi:hypothetical protein AB0I35_13030 [Nocardia sp. NPDC050378]|uniref:hypothetical protein n=1 Tax=Nocardia sp. NPDC050378 TaxID=3155400 RepID=UPI0033D7310D
MPTSREFAIAEAVEVAWYNHAHSHDIAIPLGTVAVLATLQVDDIATPDAIAACWAAFSDAELVRTIRTQWEALWLIEPYLVEMARPLHSWITAPDAAPEPAVLAGVRAVATAAFRRGLLELTGSADPEHRSDTDVLGAVLTVLRSHGARQAIGEFHTPAAVADLMARMTLGHPLPPRGAMFSDPFAIDEPAAGTGGLMRAMAQAIRALGGDPGDYVWSMTDIDRYAIAACAVKRLDLGAG